MAKEVALAGAPTDGISSLSFLDNSHLACGSWDSSVKVFHAQANDGPRKVCRHKAPVLDVAPGPSAGSILSGGLDMDVHLYDTVADRELILGSHANAVKCVLYAPEANVVISGGWDKTIRVWDAASAGSASSSSSSSRQLAKIDVPDRVYTMASVGGGSNRLVVGTAGRQILTYDTRKLSSSPSSASSASSASSSSPALISSRESSLKHQTRCIRAPPSGDFLAVASTEGRVAIDYLRPEMAAQSYAFKCHRKKDGDSSEIVYPVHALAFHPGYGTFATGGGDGTVCLWDAKGRKRLLALGPFPNSVTALAFSPDGATLAIASSYDHSAGDKEHAPDVLYVRAMADAEVKPKAVKA